MSPLVRITDSSRTSREVRKVPKAEMRPRVYSALLIKPEAPLRPRAGAHLPLRSRAACRLAPAACPRRSADDAGIQRLQEILYNNGSRALIRSLRRHPPTPRCDGHSGSPACRNPSSYRERSSARQGPTRSLRVETRSAGLSCRSRAIALCACSGRPAIALLATAIRNPG